MSNDVISTFAYNVGGIKERLKNNPVINKQRMIFNQRAKDLIQLKEKERKVNYCPPNVDLGNDLVLADTSVEKIMEEITKERKPTEALVNLIAESIEYEKSETNEK